MYWNAGWMQISTCRDFLAICSWTADYTRDFWIYASCHHAPWPLTTSVPDVEQRQSLHGCRRTFVYCCLCIVDCIVMSGSRRRKCKFCLHDHWCRSKLVMIGWSFIEAVFLNILGSSGEKRRGWCWPVEMKERNRWSVKKTHPNSNLKFVHLVVIHLVSSLSFIHPLAWIFSFVFPQSLYMHINSFYFSPTLYSQLFNSLSRLSLCWVPVMHKIIQIHPSSPIHLWELRIIFILLLMKVSAQVHGSKKMLQASWSISRKTHKNIIRPRSDRINSFVELSF